MELSIVVPIYNEEKNLPLLYEAILEAMKSYNKSWEVVFVDDGSSDTSLQVLEALAEKNPSTLK